ncbi:RES domain-containing protein [Enterococcus casseliflavus]|nr:RES domain-containing protein [Enterococcus casseliflavus]
MILSRKEKRRLLKRFEKSSAVRSSKLLIEEKTITLEIPDNDQVASRIEEKLLSIENIFDGIDEKTSEFEVSELVTDVLMYDFLDPLLNDEEFPVISSSYIPLPECREFVIERGDLCFRIREDYGSLEKNIEGFTLNDFWNPPKEFTSIGRLNKENDPVLYVAEDILTACKEMKFSKESQGYLNVYRATQRISLRYIGYESEEKLYKIMRRLFIEEINLPETYKYKLTQEIANRFFPYDPYDMDGWAYPSIANRGNKHSAAIDLSKKDKLELLGSLKFKVISKEEILVNHVVIPKNDSPFFITNMNNYPFGSFSLTKLNDVINLLINLNKKNI